MNIYENMYGEYGIFLFAGAAVLVYLTALTSAFLSWRRYRFSAWLFVPMILLLILPVAIFPIYAYSEYSERKKKAMEFSPELSKVKRWLSWMPLAAGFVFIWIMTGFSYFTPEVGIRDVFGPLDTALGYVVSLLVAVVFLLVGNSLDKYIRSKTKQ